jgi:polyisoprenoid-binding protein YceI
MTRLTALLAATALSLGVYAETFTIDTGHAEIGFSVKHLMVSNTKGKFNSFRGTFEYDMGTKTLKSAQGTIKTASIDTNNEKRDGHLRNEDFFHVEKHPEMVFKSTSVEQTGKNEFTVKGALTVLGVDREVVLPVRINGPVDDPWGNKRIGVVCKTVLNRRDLGITHSPAAVIGDEIEVDIEVEAIHQ